MDVGIVILSPNVSYSGVRNTLGSLSLYSYNRESICVVGNNATSKDLKELKTLCPTYKGKDTITSLINIGIKKNKHEWSFIMFGGSRIPHRVEWKWNMFCKSNKDILYPLAEKHCDFVEGCFNGVLVNNEFFKEVGDFPSAPVKKEGFNDFEFSKLLWGIDALQKGAIFKGVLGMRSL